MLKPNEYDLNREYRNRQINRANRAQLIDSATDNPKPRNPLLEANLISTFWIVASLVALIIFFFFGATSTYAQEETVITPGEYSPGNNDLAYLYLRSAVIAIEAEDYDSASFHIGNALDVSPDLAPAYIARSYMELQRDNSELALADATYAYELNASDNSVYFMLAEAHFALGQYDEAQGHYNTYMAVVTVSGEQPILITSMLGADSLPVVTAHLDVCIAQNS